MSTPPHLGSSEYEKLKSDIYNGGTLDDHDVATKDLFVAVFASNIDGINDAIRRGADISAVDAYGKQVAHYAADTIVAFKDGSLYKELLIKLKSLGANMLAPDDERLTPIGQFMNGYREELNYNDMKNPKAVLSDGLAAWAEVGVDTSKYKPRDQRSAGGRY